MVHPNSMRKDLKANEERCEELEQLLYAETKKAQMRRNGELATLDIKIKQADALLAAKRNKLEVRAPFAGQVVYRHPSPGAALTHGPVLVMSPPEGLRFHFRLDDSQVEALRSAGIVTVELEETSNSIEQRFPGRFLTATALTRDPGMSLVDLECHAPPETVAALADDKPIKARFSWRPPMMNMWPFPVALILLGLGILGMFLARVSEWKPALVIPKKTGPIEDDEESIVSYSRTPAKEGDTVEARDTIPERPVLPTIPRERTYEPWEHPVGIRLREAIIRQDISAELLSAIETAIEQKQDAVIVPIREALRRAPSVPNQARLLLDRLNSCDSDNEVTQMEQRQLAQRLTFLLYTIGLEIPSEPSYGGRVDARFAGR